METADLKKAGLKVTLPRMKILELLEASKTRHQTAEDIYKALLDAGEEIGLATVYRVLTQFEAAGLVVRHHFEGGHSVFELADDEKHDHIVCVKCGRVKEFSDPELNARQQEIAERLGFTISDRTLYLYGVCKGGCEDS